MMTFRTTPARYGLVPVTLHWLSAVAILLMIASGLAMENVTNTETRAALLRLHVAVGGLVAVLTLLRIWWAVVDRLPERDGSPRWLTWAARGVHYAIYGVVLCLVATGAATLGLTGAFGPLFSGEPASLPAFGDVATYTAHVALFITLTVLMAAHIAAALWHQFVLRDGLMARMGLGRNGEPT
jgi:cytochrome b561